MPRKRDWRSSCAGGESHPKKKGHLAVNTLLEYLRRGGLRGILLWNWKSRRPITAQLFSGWSVRIVSPGRGRWVGKESEGRRAVKGMRRRKGPRIAIPEIQLELVRRAPLELEL